MWLWGSYRSFYSFFCLAVAGVSPVHPYPGYLSFILFRDSIFLSEEGYGSRLIELAGSWHKLIQFSLITKRETEARSTELDRDGIPLKVTLVFSIRTDSSAGSPLLV